MDFHLKTRGMIYNTWERTGVCMVWHGLATPSIQEFHLQQGCLDMFPSVQCRMVCTERRGVSGIRDAWRGQHWLKLTANKQREKTLYQTVPLSLFIRLHPITACTFDLFYSLHFTTRPSCRPQYFHDFLWLVLQSHFVAFTSHKLCACALGMLDKAGCRF